MTPIRKDAGLCCGSRLRSGEVFAYVGLPHNLKDLKGLKDLKDLRPPCTGQHPQSGPTPPPEAAPPEHPIEELIYQANGSNAKPMAPTCAESSDLLHVL